MPVFPSEVRRYAKPMRGAKFAIRLSVAAFGQPGSPPTVRPAGAFWNFVDLTPGWKQVTRPNCSWKGKNGSQRSPRISDRRWFTRQLSCAYEDQRVPVIYVNSPPPWVNCDTRPIRKSARLSPLRLLVNVK